jgi:hypothetical protein
MKTRPHWLLALALLACPNPKESPAHFATSLQRLAVDLSAGRKPMESIRMRCAAFSGPVVLFANEGVCWNFPTVMGSEATPASWTS